MADVFLGSETAAWSVNTAAVSQISSVLKISVIFYILTPENGF